MTETVGRPEISEFAPHAKGYVDLVQGDDVIGVLRNQIESTSSLLQQIGDRRATEFTYAPGKWTVKQIVGHLSDTERIFTYRALRIARNDRTPLPSFHQDGYVAAADANSRTLEDLIDELRAVRESSLFLFKSLPREAWMRQGEVSEKVLTVRGIAFTLVGHELHHYDILRERYLP